MRPRVLRVMSSRVPPKAMNHPSAVEGAPPLVVEPWPSAGLGRKGVRALNSHRVCPATMSGIWVAQRCAYFLAAVSLPPRVPSPLSPSWTGHVAAALTAVSWALGGPYTPHPRELLYHFKGPPF